MAIEVFVNPYSFVPMPNDVKRAEPIGHSGKPREEVFSGSIDVTWTLATPLLLPATAAQEGWIQRDGRIRLPGSSIKGAVRSLHEAMFNGCFRIVDDGFVPAYRDPVSGPLDTSEWRLAIVTASAQGQPTEFQLTREGSTEYVDAHALKASMTGGLPTSGDIVVITGARETNPGLQRTEVKAISSVQLIAGHSLALTSAGPFRLGRIFLVTDTAARTGTHVYWASGELDSTCVEFDAAHADADAWNEFHAVTRRANDRRELEGGGQEAWRRETVHKVVNWPARGGQPIGQRARQSGLLFRGDVVWVRPERGRITGIRLAQVWRSTGQFAVGERLGNAKPCPDPDNPSHLCLSCATFGSATVDGVRGEGDQTSYAGHVRFSSAVSTERPTLIELPRLAPMGTPNPGAGTFYLKLPQERPNVGTDEVPSHWGTAESTAAKLRGRKFYWHSDPDAQAKRWSSPQAPRPPRYVAVENAQGMIRAATLVPAGTIFTATVTVDRLDRVGLDALMGSLNPAYILGVTDYATKKAARFAVHLGGGKPLGLGSAEVSVEPHVTPTRDRYSNPAMTEPMTFAQMTREMLMPVARRVGLIGAGLESLAHLLDLHGLGDHEVLVSYPPNPTTNGWSDFSTPEFRRSFKFFQETNGKSFAQQVNQWRLLPPASAPDVSLPIRNRRQTRHNGQG